MLEDGKTPIPPLPLRDSSYPVLLGAVSPWSYFAGSLDEFRLWSTARSGDEVAADYRRLTDPAAPGLVAAYHLDEGADVVAADVTGGHEGTLVAGVAWTPTAPCTGSDCPPFQGAAVRTDGASGVVFISDDPQLDFVLTGTVEAWFRATPGHAGGVLVCKGDGLDAFTDRAFTVGVIANAGGSGLDAVSVEFFLGPAFAERNYVVVVSPPSLLPGQWHHVAATIDTGAGECRVYLDGELAAITTTLEDGVTPIPAIPVRDSSYPVTIGAVIPWSYFRGRIDEVRLWNTVRSAGAIASGYRAGVDPAADGLAAYYRFDDAAGPTASDATGHGHTGSLWGETAWVSTDLCCTADFNDDGVVNSTDVSDFINAWFADLVLGTSVTDWDRNGVVNSTDVSDFINSWFADSAAACG